jgi:hypothetical protein
MEVLKNMLVGLLAGDLVLWSLVVIVALVVWVVADAAFWRGDADQATVTMMIGCMNQSRWDRSEDDPLIGALCLVGYGHGTNSDGTSRM